jgi:hypothetical protein
MPPPRPRVAQLDCLRGSEREIPTTKRRKAHKACPEDRQGTTLATSTGPPGRSEPSFYGCWLDMAESELGVLGSPRVRKLLGYHRRRPARLFGMLRSAPSLSGNIRAKSTRFWRAQSAYRGKPGLHRCE